MKYSFSIVSHNQQHLCKAAIDSIIDNVDEDFEVLLTLKTSEELVIDLDSNINFKIIPNPKPLGFGTNHNNAFKLSG
jgi:GT2 family glycosyltransferase